MNAPRPATTPWPGLADRGSPQSQALLSAALLVPAVALFYLRSWPYEVGLDTWTYGEAALWMVGGTLLIDAYFVVVVVLLTRDRRRLATVSLLAISAMPVDVACWALAYLGAGGDLAVALGLTLAVASVVLSVAAWGVARRRNPMWTVGLSVSVPVVVVVSCLPYLSWAADDSWLLSVWVLVATFVACCLVCWLFDVLGARQQRISSTIGVTSGLTDL